MSGAGGSRQGDIARRNASTASSGGQRGAQRTSRRRTANRG